MPASRTPEGLLPLSADTLMILMSLAVRPRHGYGIIQDVAERSNDEVQLQTGALYRLIKRLLGEGAIVECAAPEDEPTNGPPRRYYRTSAFGREVLLAEADRMSRLVRAVRLTTAGKQPRLA